MFCFKCCIHSLKIVCLLNKSIPHLLFIAWSFKFVKGKKLFFLLNLLCFLVQRISYYVGFSNLGVLKTKWPWTLPDESLFTKQNTNTNFVKVETCNRLFRRINFLFVTRLNRPSCFSTRAGFQIWARLKKKKWRKKKKHSVLL